MSTVFISYKRENQQAVHRLVQALRNEGLDVWWDGDIPPDAPWEATIERELEASKVVVVAWSQAAVQSENVKAEARRARQQGKLIQVFVETCDPPLFFGERQGVDLSSWNGGASDARFQTVLAAVRAVVAGRAPPSGVGFVAKRGPPWAMLTAAFVFVSAVLGFVSNLGGARDTVCGLSAISTYCAQWGLTSAAEPTTEERQAALIRAVNGVWGRLDRDCTNTVTYSIEETGDRAYRLRASAPGFESSEQVVSIDASANVVTTRQLTPNEQGVRETFEYRVNGDILAMRDARGVDTTMVRCPAPS